MGRVLSLGAPAPPPPGMRQVLFAGGYLPLINNATAYSSPMGGSAGWNVTETLRHRLVSTSGVIKNLRVKLLAAPGAGKKYNFTYMLNGAPTALTAEIANAATTGSDMINEFAVAAGDTISIRCVPTGTPTITYAYWSAVFSGALSGESLIIQGFSAGLSTAQTRYLQVMGSLPGYSTIENNHREVVPTAGTIKNLYVELSAGPGVVDDAYRFTLRKNGVSQTLTVTITAGATTGNDTVHPIDVVAGDILTMMVEPLNIPAVSPYAILTMTFVADVNGESIVMGGSYKNLNASQTEYQYITSIESTDWVAAEGSVNMLGQICTLRKLYILLSGAPSAGREYTFILRVGGADTNVVAIVADTDITGNSGALTDTVADDDYVTLKVVPTGNPTVRNAYWGFVSYIEP